MVVLFLTYEHVIKPGCTCFSYREWRKRKIKIALRGVNQLFKCLVHLSIQSLGDSVRYGLKKMRVYIRNIHTKAVQCSILYKTMPPLTSATLISLFWLLKR